jgi:hypothetical protein
MASSLWIVADLVVETDSLFLLRNPLESSLSPSPSLFPHVPTQLYQSLPSASRFIPDLRIIISSRFPSSMSSSKQYPSSFFSSYPPILPIRSDIPVHLYLSLPRLTTPLDLLSPSAVLTVYSLSSLFCNTSSFSVGCRRIKFLSKPSGNWVVSLAQLGEPRRSSPRLGARRTSGPIAKLWMTP